MDSLQITDVKLLWSENSNQVQINIELPKFNSLLSFLKKNDPDSPTPKIKLESTPDANRIFVRNGDRFDKIMHQDILYLEAQGAYTLIHTRSKSYTISRNLTRCCKGLVYPFMRVHRSFTVNLDNVDSFTEASIFYGDQRIPLSESTKKELQVYFNRI